MPNLRLAVSLLIIELGRSNRCQNVALSPGYTVKISNQSKLFSRPWFQCLPIVGRMQHLEPESGKSWKNLKNTQNVQ